MDQNFSERIKDVTYRFEQIEYFDLFIRFYVEVWGQGVREIEIYEGGKVILHANTNLLVNSNFALGIVSARSLLEFLGLRPGKNPYELKERKSKQADDIVIEGFLSKDGVALKQLTPFTVRERFLNQWDKVERALWELMTDASKGTAHITNLRKEDPATFAIYRYGIKALRVLLKEQFYSQIGSEPPGPYVFKHPVNQSEVSTPLATK